MDFQQLSVLVVNSQLLFFEFLLQLFFSPLHEQLHVSSADQLAVVDAVIAFNFARRFRRERHNFFKNGVDNYGDSAARAVSGHCASLRMQVLNPIQGAVRSGITNMKGKSVFGIIHESQKEELQKLQRRIKELERELADERKKRQD